MTQKWKLAECLKKEIWYLAEILELDLRVGRDVKETLTKI
jgi:hypothetical protein